MDLQYIHVTAVDKKGRPVCDYNEPLSVEVLGCARFMALDNGDHYSDELFEGVETKKMYNGRILIILRNKKQVGEVQLKVSSLGLKGKLLLKTF